MACINSGQIVGKLTVRESIHCPSLASRPSARIRVALRGAPVVSETSCGTVLHNVPGRPVTANMIVHGCRRVCDSDIRERSISSKLSGDEEEFEVHHVVYYYLWSRWSIY